MRPAKSFWKNVQLWRTTCQWLCHRIRLVKLGAIAWLVNRFFRNNPAGRTTSSTAAMPSSCQCARAQSSAAPRLLASATTLPRKKGMRLSTTAVKMPTANSARTSARDWRTKCQ